MALPAGRANAVSVRRSTAAKRNKLCSGARLAREGADCTESRRVGCTIPTDDGAAPRTGIDGRAAGEMAAPLWGTPLAMTGPVMGMLPLPRIGLDVVFALYRVALWNTKQRG
ncbi:hypothetical protein NK553_10985 [Pseudomonas sp. ZM23]|uniref:Uncharacterized protein n=1 Tax=Pseudomonas triclosanedens TaxID=2961893 RepID=A0ABY7A1S9_9PSED|nr:hypothetical protein [Pseudomonas triclosanedens]MCP8464474.1 hypothetical protein [Pseudomonas triclosanedens]MCP8471608.1 hypothetical protein [Pseudomonas triclosanedens]MCP8477580.1 hypothetical protein [Pseudomonas triclosanedens]WAI51043.1 hypothetical protein OU419_07230 [Pseudomonas triclosanedens]